MKYTKLKAILDDYNWDDGFDVPRKLLKDPECNLALALEIFDLADGYAYLFDMDNAGAGLKEWRDFVTTLYNDIINGKYPQTENKYEISLTRVQKFKLKKLGIPDIFLE